MFFDTSSTVVFLLLSKIKYLLKNTSRLRAHDSNTCDNFTNGAVTLGGETISLKEERYGIKSDKYML